MINHAAHAARSATSVSASPRPLRLSGVDSLRGIAAMAVAVCHIYQQFFDARIGLYPHEFLTWLGSWGIALFFVLSGFCIHLPQARRKCAASPTGNPALLAKRDFLLQRFLRIMPPYWMAIAIAVFVGTFGSTNIIAHPATWWSVPAHMAGLHGLFPGMLHDINGVFWTIGVEIQFYLFYFLLADRSFRLTGIALFLVIGLAIYGSVSVLFPTGSPARAIGQHFFLVFFWQWYAGAWLAEKFVAVPGFVTSNDFSAYVWRCLALALSLLLAFQDPTVAGLHIRYRLLPAACLGVLATFLISPRSYLRWPSRIGVALGDMSYSIYLLHPVAIWIAIQLSPGSHPALTSAVALGVTLALGAASYRAVELPIQRFRQAIPAASR